MEITSIVSIDSAYDKDGEGVSLIWKCNNETSIV